MSELISLNEFSKQYHQYLQIGLTSFMLFLAGCGTVSISNIESISASSTVLTSEEASCNNRVSEDVINARQNDARFMLNQGRALEEVKQMMMSFCDGITN